MAAFACLGLETPFLIGFHHLMRALLEGIEDILVAHLAGSGADEFRRLVVRGLSLGGRGSGGGRFLLNRFEIVDDAELRQEIPKNERPPWRKRNLRPRGLIETLKREP